MIKKICAAAVFVTLLSTMVVLGVNNADDKKSEPTSTYTVADSTYKTTPETTNQSAEIGTKGTTSAKSADKTSVSLSTVASVSRKILSSGSQHNSDAEPMSYTDDDLYYLAAAVCREAGGSSEEIQLLVANVIMNRVSSSSYPDTIYGVLTQHMQYGTMWRYGVSFPDWAGQKTKDQCYSVARRILNGERFCPENVVFQAEFKQGSGVFKQFDGFYFCYA